MFILKADLNGQTYVGKYSSLEDAEKAAKKYAKGEVTITDEKGKKAKKKVEPKVEPVVVEPVIAKPVVEEDKEILDMFGYYDSEEFDNAKSST